MLQTTRFGNHPAPQKSGILPLEKSIYTGEQLSQPQSSDALKLSQLEALNRLKGPSIRGLDSFFDLFRRTGDTIAYPGNIRLENFARVDDTVYRGIMPTSGPHFEKLKTAYHVNTLIDLRGEETTAPKYINFEKAWAKYYGIRHVHIPMSSHRPPTIPEIARFFQAIEDAKASGGQVYVHCKHGIDRSGVMVAAYETKLGLSGKTVYSHMTQNGYNILHQLSRPAMKAFVKSPHLRTIVAEAEKLRLKERQSQAAQCN